MYFTKEFSNAVSGCRRLFLSVVLHFLLSNQISFAGSGGMRKTLLSQQVAAESSQPLLIFLVDSLRWDFPELSESRSSKKLVGFEKLKRLGGFVDRISPVFPAECYPNVISLLTGLYPADHGVIFTEMYDERTNQTLQYDLVQPHGRMVFSGSMDKKIHLFHLPMCSSSDDARIKCEAYSSDRMTPIQLNDTLRRAVDELRNGSSDVAIVYYDRLDHVGHLYGPLSDEMLVDEVPQLDMIVDHLVGRLQSESVNLVVTSDHGMAEIKGKASLDRFVSRDHVSKVINRGSIVSIWPVAGHEDAVRHRLTSKRIKSFMFFSNLTIPEEWHTGGEVFPPILLVAKPGYIIESSFWPIDLGHYKILSKLQGAHGYDHRNKDMHVPLFALGPQIRPGSVHRAVGEDQLDTHLLIAFLIGQNASLQAEPGSSIIAPSFDHSREPPDYSVVFFKNAFSATRLLTIVCVIAVLLLTAFVILLYQISACTTKDDVELEVKLLTNDVCEI